MRRREILPATAPKYVVFTFPNQRLYLGVLTSALSFASHSSSARLFCVFLGTFPCKEDEDQEVEAEKEGEDVD